MESQKDAAGSSNTQTLKDPGKEKDQNHLEQLEDSKGLQADDELEFRRTSALTFDRMQATAESADNSGSIQRTDEGPSPKGGGMPPSVAMMTRNDQRKGPGLRVHLLSHPQRPANMR